MNNLFKKGFASLALASVITSNMFGAVNVAMIDVKKEFGTDGLSKFTVLTNAEVKDTNAAFNGLTIVGGKKIIASAQVAETNNTAYNDFTRSIIKDELGQKFESISLAFTPHKLGDISGSLNGMSLALAGAKSIGGDMKLGYTIGDKSENSLNGIPLVFTGAKVIGGDMKFGNNMKPGHNMLNIPLAFIGAKSLGAQTGTSKWLTNKNNVIAFKRTDLTKSGIHNPVIKHLSLANVGFSPSIIPLSKHTGDNLAFFVLNEGSILTPSLGKNNMNNTGLISNYVLGNNTAGISCASPVNKVNSNPHSSNCIRNDLTVTNIILNPTGDSEANFAKRNFGVNFAILGAV